MGNRSRSSVRVKPRFWVLVLTVIAVVFGVVYSLQDAQLAASIAQVNDLNAKKNELAEDLVELQRKIDFTETDEYILQEAHRQGLVGEGEILFMTTEGDAEE